MGKYPHFKPTPELQQEVKQVKKEKQTRLTDSPIPPAPKVAGILG